MFWMGRKVLDVEEMKKIIAELKLKLLDFEMELARLKSNQISLRGLVNRKMGGLEDDTQSKDIYKGVFLPDKDGI